MINLAWGGLTNGEIPTSLLVDVSGRGDYLEPTAAAEWLRLVAACRAATGVTLTPAPGSSANRPRTIQDEFYAERQAYLAGRGPYFPVAAVPGTSNHGWARALDITGYEGNTPWRSPRTGTVYMVNITAWNWLLAHAAEYGFDWTTGDYSGEAWHWESLTPPGTAVASVGGATPIGNTPTKIRRPTGRLHTEEDDMSQPIIARGDKLDVWYALYNRVVDSTADIEKAPDGTYVATQSSGPVYFGRRLVGPGERAAIAAYKLQTGFLMPDSNQKEVVEMPQATFDQINKVAGSDYSR